MFEGPVFTIERRGVNEGFGAAGHEIDLEKERGIPLRGARLP